MKARIMLGEYPVIDVHLGVPKIQIGNGVNFTINMGTFPHAVRVGDFLPLFTEVEYAQPIRANSKSSS